MECVCTAFDQAVKPENPVDKDIIQRAEQADDDERSIEIGACTRTHLDAHLELRPRWLKITRGIFPQVNRRSSHMLSWEMRIATERRCASGVRIAVLSVKLTQFFDAEIWSLAGLDDLLFALFDLFDPIIELIGDFDRYLTDTMFVTVEQISWVDG
jgi:hypothetical protein